MKTFKKHRDYGFWDQDIRLSKLSHLGDPLEKLNKGVDFEMFRVLLMDRLTKEPQGKGGRPPYDYVMMFKIIILQRYYNLSDDQVEYQINDRMSFMRFLNLSIADDIPDSKTVWHFGEQLTDLGLVEELFALFLAELDRLNLIVNEGKIIDASFLEVPLNIHDIDFLLLLIKIYSPVACLYLLNFILYPVAASVYWSRACWSVFCASSSSVSKPVPAW